MKLPTPGVARLRRRVAAAAIAALFLAAPARAAEPQPRLAGDTHLHDPSIIEVDGAYVAFGTGETGRNRGAIRLKTSSDGLTWVNRGALGDGVPGWALQDLGFLPSDIWAPSISRRGGVFSLYYCVSSFGANTSAIGLMTNTAFDPKQPQQGWVDQGRITQSGPGDDFNAIDPFRIDLADGRAFLSYGSFWSGVKLRELDPATGKLADPAAPALALAARAGGGAVEASSLLERAGKFYLFVSFDQCCKGVASTYNMRVGRADRIEGPYRDRQGVDMRQGGGSLLQATSGRFIGPGGEEPVATSKGEWLAYHYYDGDAGGSAKLQFSPLGWTEDGWPELGALPP